MEVVRYGDNDFGKMVRVLNLRRKFHAFPNGSAYHRIEPKNYVPVFEEREGWKCRWQGGKTFEIIAPDGREGYATIFPHLGDGVSLGVHFNNRSEEWEGTTIRITWKS